ncbi:hypothetical protein HMPREF1603_04139 [Escherichia coli 907892]|nr:hypothetical protein HMPREF1603_04139 [Escherichia coli 907892]
MCVGRIRRSRRIRHLSIVPDATLDASYQAYRCTASGKPYSHQQRKLPFVFR